MDDRSALATSVQEFHPVAEAWPLLQEVELQALADDIAANGLHYPIWRHQDGRIVDGRNRWLACQKAGVECPSNRYLGEDGAELIAFVVSMNDQRRHMTESQRSLVAANLASLKQGARTDLGPIGPMSQAEAAKLMNVGVRSVKRAKVVKDSGDEETIKAVEKGEMSVSAAEKKLRQKAPPKSKAPPKPKAKPKLTVVQDSRPPHLTQFVVQLRAIGETMHEFADVGEAASLAERHGSNINDDHLAELIEFLSDLLALRKAGQAA
jgi:ParB-like chromosome segregation protein Spo0J